MQNEFDLVLEFRKGNQEAYRKLHEELYGSIYYFASRLIGNKDDANDIATEVFEKLWTLRSNFDTYQNLKAFLYLATRNACLSYLDIQTRLAAQNKELLKQLANKEEDLYRPDLLRIEMIRAEMLEYIYKELNKLPKQTRKVVKMRFKKKMTHKAIAARLHLTEGRVRNLFCAGIRQLREIPGLRKRWIELEMLTRD
jgi:RNA polymerase sigma factor (sigma-70 family)